MLRKSQPEAILYYQLLLVFVCFFKCGSKGNGKGKEMQDHFFLFQVKLLSCTVSPQRLALIHGLTNSYTTSFKSKGGPSSLFLFREELSSAYYV